MSKIKTNKILSTIVLGLEILVILAFAFALVFPLESKAQYTTGYYGGTPTGPSYPNAGSAYQYSYSGVDGGTYSNPVPHISYVDPNDASSANGNIRVNVRGSNFVPSSIVKWDNLSRPTVYNNSGLLTVNISQSDLSFAGRHVITVYNPAPSGGTSNGVYFTAESRNGNAGGATRSNTSSNSNSVNSNSNNGVDYDQINDDFSNLTSNAIYGSGSFMPSGLVGWVMFAIVVLIIIILVRKILGFEKKYHATPLKHS